MKRVARQLDLALTPFEALQRPARAVDLAGVTECLREKDPALLDHSHRVAFFADLLAQRLQLPEGMVGQVRTGAFLHDVGKLGVAHGILLKPGQLDASQLREMRRHPVLGARMLRDLSLPRGVVAGVLHHHEWWDGSGYPDGLSAGQIPLAARIITVCDAFDSMNSHRPYRRALSRQTIFDEFQSFTGRQFEPYLVDAFLRILETGVCDPPLLPASSSGGCRAPVHPGRRLRYGVQ